MQVKRAWLLFCLFAEDVGIFEADLFKSALVQTKADLRRGSRGGALRALA
ncbi:type IIL restriction-modification enzyme MmeI [uncultured Methylobacterium sp.]|nr:type IIL restriction-modification enzyme MmeI [uncultured Methylobacterium sp.]